MTTKRTGDVGIWADCTPEDFPPVNLLEGPTPMTTPYQTLSTEPLVSDHHTPETETP